MPFLSKKPQLKMTQETTTILQGLSNSRTEPMQRIERARILLAFAGGDTISAIARQFRTNRMKVERCVNKAIQLGVMASLDDLPGRGKPAKIPEDARTWVLSLACQKPKDLGYSYEMWTTRLLAAHIQKHCIEAGHPSLAQLSRGTVSKILTKSKIRPHKIVYYLERRDPEFEAKMVHVLCVYEEVALLRKAGHDESSMVAVLSYDEKPGIQAIENIAPDMPPVHGSHQTWGRDYEYIRHGTVSLLAGIDLLTGKVYGIVEDRHRSREFIGFLKMLDSQYPAGTRLRMILDNHSAHISKETRSYLAIVPGRFEFIFTPTHGSWLNLVESFFGKMARTMLRGIRVASKAELKERIVKYLAEANEVPVVFRWKYGIDSSLVASA
jgi:transposase